MQAQHNISTIELHDLTFSFSSEAPLFSSLSFALTQGRVGLIGDNGCGKTTLLHLIAGELQPISGTIHTHGSLYFLKQSHALDQNLTIAEFLHVNPYLVALERVEQGLGTGDDIVLLDGHWDIQERLTQLLEAHGLQDLTPDRKLREISGGQATMLALAASNWIHPDILLLDEPTNNLDSTSRNQLYQAIEQHKGLVLTATHDRALLTRMDKIVELKDGKVLIIDGNYDVYLDHIKLLEASSERHLKDAQKELNRIKRQRQAIEQRQARQRKSAAKAQASKQSSKMSMNGLKRKAQVSAAQERKQFEERLQRSQNEKDRAQSAIRTHAHIKVSDLSVGALHRKQIVTLEDRNGHIIAIGGGQRVALSGRNGVGKSRLIESLFDPSIRPHLHAWGTAHIHTIGVIRQNVLDLNANNTLIEELCQGATHNLEEARTQLARMLFRGDAAHTKVSALSGGQRFHIALAKLLIHKPAYEMIILDEPTNNLDISSLNQVAELLKGYQGALLVISHDQAFLEDIGIETTVYLDEEGIHE